MPDTFTCPGCGKDMTGFVAHEAHYADDLDRRGKVQPWSPEWPWTSLHVAADTFRSLGSVCPWTRDYLSAEWLRRHPQPWSYS